MHFLAMRINFRMAQGAKPETPGMAVCARLGCLTSCWMPGVRRLSPALRCTSVQLRLQCSRPQLGGRNAALAMQAPIGNLQCCKGARQCAKAATLLVLAQAELKAVIKVHRHALCLCSNFGRQGCQRCRLIGGRKATKATTWMRMK